MSSLVGIIIVVMVLFFAFILYYQFEGFVKNNEKYIFSIKDAKLVSNNGEPRYSYDMHNKWIITLNKNDYPAIFGEGYDINVMIKLYDSKYHIDKVTQTEKEIIITMDDYMNVNQIFNHKRSFTYRFLNNPTPIEQLELHEMYKHDPKGVVFMI